MSAGETLGKIQAEMLRAQVAEHILTEGVRRLANECNCRREHGAEGGEHLEYIETRLKELLTNKGG